LILRPHSSAKLAMEILARCKAAVVSAMETLAGYKKTLAGYNAAVVSAMEALAGHNAGVVSGVASGFLFFQACAPIEYVALGGIGGCILTIFKQHPDRYPSYHVGQSYDIDLVYTKGMQPKHTEKRFFCNWLGLEGAAWGASIMVRFSRWMEVERQPDRGLGVLFGSIAGYLAGCVYHLSTPPIHFLEDKCRMQADKSLAVEFNQGQLLTARYTACNGLAVEPCSEVCHEGDSTIKVHVVAADYWIEHTDRIAFFVVGGFVLGMIRDMQWFAAIRAAQARHRTAQWIGFGSGCLSGVVSICAAPFTGGMSLWGILPSSWKVVKSCFKFDAFPDDVGISFIDGVIDIIGLAIDLSR